MSAPSTSPSRSAPRAAAPRRHRRLVGAVAAVLVACTVTPASATAPRTTHEGEARRFVTGWAPYWSPSTSAESFRQAADLFEEVSPFWYQATIDANTIVPNTSPAGMAALVDAARAEGVPVLPSITDGHPKGGLAAILDDRTTRRRHVQAIVDLVLANGYDGIDLDYEGFAFVDGRDTWASTRPDWARFVRQLAAALHRHGRLLSVTVPPIWAGGTQGYTVYAWPEIAPHVDRLRIMTYDWSFSAAGPIAPIWWVRDTIAYAATVVPMSKVQIGIPGYGREWTVSTVGTCPADQLPSTESHTLREIADVLEQAGATPTRDARSGEMRATYTRTIRTQIGGARGTRPAGPERRTADALDHAAVATQQATRLGTCVITREIWYADATALAARARAATAAGSGVALWALGYETPTEWAALRGVGTTLDGPSGTAPVGTLEEVAVTDPTAGLVAVRGWAFDPEGDLPIQVQVTVRSRATGETTSRTTVLARLDRPDVAAAHPGAGSFHGFDLTMPLVALGGDPAGRHSVCVTALGRYAAPASTALGCRSVRVTG